MVTIILKHISSKHTDVFYACLILIYALPGQNLPQCLV